MSLLKLARYATLSLVFLLLIGCSSSPAITPVPPVDPEQLILFHHGVVLTMNPEQPEATALALRGEKIIEVGGNEAILALQEPGATVIDLNGATIMPGFVDPHNHLFNDAKGLSGMSLVEVQEVGLAQGITTQGDLYVDEGFFREMRQFEEAGGL